MGSGPSAAHLPPADEGGGRGGSDDLEAGLTVAPQYPIPLALKRPSSAHRWARSQQPGESAPGAPYQRAVALATCIHTFGTMEPPTLVL